MYTLRPLGESLDDAHPPSCAAARRAPATATAESVIPLLVVCNAKHWRTVGSALTSDTNARTYFTGEKSARTWARDGDVSGIGAMRRGVLAGRWRFCGCAQRE